MSFLKNIANKALKTESVNVMLLPSGGGSFWNINSLIHNPNKVDIFAGWAFIAMNHIATAVSATKYYAERKDKDGYTTLTDEDHWSAYLLENPNPEQEDFETITKLTAMDFLEHGKAYQRSIIGERIKVPIQLFGIPSVAIRNNYGTRTGDPMIIDYTLQAGGGTITIPKSEMIYIKDLTARSYETSTVDGQPSMLNAAMEAILNAGERLEFNRRFLSRDGKMPYIVTTDLELGDIQANTLLSRIRESMGSIFRPEILLDKGIKVESLVQGGNGINSMVEIPNRELVEHILACFNSNIAVVTGLHANRNTQISTMNEYYYTAVEPISKKICKGLTRNFKQYDGTIRISFEARREQDVDFMLRQNESDIANGLKTPNEVLTERGYPTFEGGDIRIIKYGFQKLESVTNPPEILDEITSESSYAEISKALKKKLL